MEAFLKDSSKAKGVEVLYFEKAEIEKFKNNSCTFAGFGSLSVLFFEAYGRFVLQINDWRYPLVRRLPVVSDGNSSSPTYTFPALNGFLYRLKLDSEQCQGLKNFEAILQNNANFSVKGKEAPAKEIEASPEDSLKRHTSEKSGLKENIEQGLKQAGEGLNNLAKNIKKGTQKLVSNKKGLSLKDIKTKDFKKESHSTFKKNFFEKNEKHSQEFLSKRKENVNQTQIEEYTDLRTNSQPNHYLTSELIENLIMDNKDLATSGDYSMNQSNLADTSNIKPAERSAGRSRVGQNPADYGRSRNMPDVKGQLESGVEGITHYQG